MQGKIAVVTGANSGIGLETARALADRGATVVMACRDQTRAAAALADVLASSGNTAVSVLPLDLASFASIHRFAERYRSVHPRLDVLVNNAGLFPLRRQLTADGFELQFGVNHLGHFLLTRLLQPQLAAAGRARVINVSSMMHHLGTIDFASFRGEKSYRSLRAYAQSKLANVLFTRELARRHKDDGISTFSLHPGGVGTNIFGRGLARYAYRVLGGFMSPARGAKTSIHLATAAGIEAHSGAYFDEFQRVKPGSALSQDMALAARLWAESERMVGP